MQCDTFVSSPSLDTMQIQSQIQRTTFSSVVVTPPVRTWFRGPDVERWESDTDSEGSDEDVDFKEGSSLSDQQVLALCM